MCRHNSLPEELSTVYVTLPREASWKLVPCLLRTFPHMPYFAFADFAFSIFAK